MAGSLVAGNYPHEKSFRKGNMTMCQISMDIPNEVLYDTHMNDKEATAFAKKMVALGYYLLNNVSIGYCSEIAGMTEEEFMLFLGSRQIDIFKFENEEELLRDVANA